LGVRVPLALQAAVQNVHDHEELEIDRKGMKMTDAVEVTEEKLGIFARVGLFYRQVVNELKKVVWPTRNMLTTYTAVVLVFVTFIIAVVSIIDLVLTKVVFWVFG
jgi:preprotein translocase subunit SecE